MMMALKKIQKKIMEILYIDFRICTYCKPARLTFFGGIMYQ